MMVEKMKKVSGVLASAFLAVIVLTYLALGLLMVFGVFYSVIPMLRGMVTEAGFLPEDVVKALETDGFSIIPFILSVSGSLVIYLVLFYHLRGFFREIKQTGLPFSETNVSRLRSMSLISIAQAVLPWLVSASLSALMRVPRLGGLFDITSLFIALVFYALSVIFSYGAELDSRCSAIV
ncbi:MAG: hypothetical protein ACI4NM_01315 [Bullifex sp.]